MTDAATEQRADGSDGELTSEQVAELVRDPALIGILRWGGHIAAEPAVMMLPAGEGWRPRTFAHFRIALLKHLEENGAHTLAELSDNPPEVLGLALNDEELAATLDSARRHGLVARLDPQVDSGTAGPADEWVVTEAGGKLTRRGVPWVLPHLGKLTAGLLTLVATGLAILGQKLTVTGGFWSISFFGLLGLLAICIVLAVVVWHRNRRIGAAWAKGPVAEDWVRWRGHFPDLRAAALRPFPRRWTLAGLALMAAGLVATLLAPDGKVWPDLLALGVALAGWGLLLLTTGQWLTRWGDIKRELELRRMTELSAATQAASRRWLATLDAQHE